MNPFLTSAILAAGPSDGEETLWMQMLVLVIIAASLGVYAFIKNRAYNRKDNRQDLEETGPEYTKSSWQSSGPHKNTSQRKDAAHQKCPAKIQDIRPHMATRPRPTVVSFVNPAMTGQKAHSESAGKEARDTKSGMELLELDLLLHIVHNTKSGDKKDITMRKLAFNELLRRENQNCIDGGALAVYAVNKGRLYDKTIQCEAMRELAQRTAHRGRTGG
jgi:hypothetical protein